jgi:hypothetical protein
MAWVVKWTKSAWAEMLRHPNDVMRLTNAVEQLRQFTTGIVRSGPGPDQSTLCVGRFEVILLRAVNATYEDDAGVQQTGNVLYVLAVTVAP